MSIRVRQRIALLLIAFMALLPLQAVHAAWSGQAMADHCQHGEPQGQTGHQATTSGHNAKCCAGQGAVDQDASGHQCSDGCDLCCSIGAAMPGTPLSTPPSESETPARTELAAATIERHVPLLRPPSALH